MVVLAVHHEKQCVSLNGNMLSPENQKRETISFVLQTFLRRGT